MNTDELESALFRAELRVVKIQTKLHRWASDDPHCRFDDVFNLVTDPGFLVAWDPVRHNKGARTVGWTGNSPLHRGGARRRRAGARVQTGEPEACSAW